MKIDNKIETLISGIKKKCALQNKAIKQLTL